MAVQAAATAARLICVVPAGASPLTYVTPAAAIVSVMIAIRALRANRETARQRATLDLIEKRESSDYYRQIARVFSEVRKADGFAALTAPADAAARERRRAVVDYLNHYELISIGIRKRFLDGNVYRAWMRGPFTRDWNAAAAWIQRERWKRDAAGHWTYYVQVFENYQTVALHWPDDTIRLDERWHGPPADDAGGPGSEALPPPSDNAP